MPHIPQFDVGAAENLDTSKPLQATRKLWSMLFLLAIKDMATVLRYAPHRGARSLSYQVDGVYHRLAPPGDELALPLLEEVERIITAADGYGDAGWLVRWLPWLADERPRAPLKALVELKIDDRAVDAIVSIVETRLGREVVAYLVDSTPEHGSCSEASHRAAQVLRRMSATRRLGQ